MAESKLAALAAQAKADVAQELRALEGRMPFTLDDDGKPTKKRSAPQPAKKIGLIRDALNNLGPHTLRDALEVDLRAAFGVDSE